MNKVIIGAIQPDESVRFIICHDIIKLGLFPKENYTYKDIEELISGGDIFKYNRYRKQSNLSRKKIIHKPMQSLEKLFQNYEDDVKYILIVDDQDEWEVYRRKKIGGFTQMT